MESINATEQLKMLGLGAPSDAAQSQKNQDKNVFLELFITQLKNQDPLNPQDATQMLGQLAQFSTVEGINNMQNTFSQLAATMQSSQALQASSLVGRQVQIPSDYGLLRETGNFSGTVSLPQAVTDLKFTITDATGGIVKQIDIGRADSGDMPFAWDGTDESGQRVAPGFYQISARATVAGETSQLETFVNADVASVTIGQGHNNIVLNLIGHEAVNLKDVRTIN